MAQILKKEKGTSSGKVAAITYVSGVASLDDRINGFVDRIKEKYPDIKIVSIMDARGQVGNTIEVVKNLLTAHKDLNGLFANNQMTGDDMVRALDILKRKDLATIAIDTSGQEIWGVENGYLDAVLTQDPWHMGYFSVAYAIMARNGVPLPKEVDTGAIVITKEELNSKLVKSIIKPFEYYKDW
jgi:ribose transport system substrate-binding protein